LDILLDGDNPLILNKCETYNEEGFTITNKEKKLRVTTTIPSALTAPFIQDIGNFTVTYTVYDRNERLGAMERTVVVNPINPCDLPPGHRCRHKCHPYAKCVFLGGADYDCECQEGFTQATDPTTGQILCKDNLPPVIQLRGPNPSVLRACRVCKWYDPGEAYNEEKHGGYIAFDNLPGGRQIDLTARVRITNESRGPEEWILFYNVDDAAGNPAETQTRIVRKEVEDVFEKVARMEQFLEDRFVDFEPARTTFNALWSYGRWLVQLLFFAVGFIILWVALPRVVALGKVLANSNPNGVSFAEHQYAYDFYYTLTRPWWNQQERDKQSMVMWQKKKYDNQ
jgi:tetrahydromethanopterin S-methyltransferase subunit B